MLAEKYKDKIAEIISRYPEKRAALLPLLWLAQEEYGHVSEGAMKEIAGVLDLTPPQVYETVTFYTMLNRQPIGKFQDRKSTRLNSSHLVISYAVFCLKK